MLGFPGYLWRLLPANPILLRVVESGGKRTRDLIIRCGYLGLLVLLVLFSFSSTNNLSEMSIQSTAIFNELSTVQLILVALLAPIFTAGAITQEKDSQTYDILLATPLTNGQIVFGSLFSRLFFVFALLLSGIPIFSITQVFGGVAIADIVLSVLIAAATALGTGALAIAIATFKIGTRRTIFSFYLINAIYLVGLMLLDQLDGLRVPLDAGIGLPVETRMISWMTPFHPFLSLRTVLDPVHYVTPTLSQLPPALRSWPVGWMLTHPAGFYITLQSVLSLLLVMPSIILLRKMAQSTTTLRQSLFGWIPIVKEKKRKPRSVWNNPIAWREARTKASASRSVAIRYSFILLGMIGTIILIAGFSTEKQIPPRFVDSGSYNANASTVFIHGQSEGTYLIDAATKITLSGNDVGPEALNARYAIDAVDISTKGTATSKSKYLRGIHLSPIARAISAEDIRRFLLGMVLVEVTAILLIITNAAASTVTREKEDGSLDLLLATPITSRYYIWGKLSGLISYVTPLLAVPVASCAVFIVYDILRYLRTRDAGFEWLVLPEAVVLMPCMLVVVFAFAGLIGMHMSLRCRTTVWAVMSSIAIMLGVTGVLGWCGFALLSNRTFSDAYVAVGSFSPVTMLMLLIAPKTAIADASVGANLAGGPRMLMLIFTLVATGAYAAIVWTMYVSMVKNFDMTIRKQSR